MVKARFEYLEIFLIGIGIVFLYLDLSSPAPKELTYVPVATVGLVTFSGILTAFIGFWLTHAYSNVTDDASKKWMSMRIRAIVFVLGFGLILTAMSTNDLVNGNLEVAYKYADFGTTMIILALVEIMYIIGFGEVFLKMKTKG